MRLSLKAITLSAAALWGAAMFLVGLVHMMVPSYGTVFLQMMSSVYPGADSSPTLLRVLLGTVYGLLDGAVVGYLFGLLYTVFAATPTSLNK